MPYTYLHTYTPASTSIFIPIHVYILPRQYTYAGLHISTPIYHTCISYMYILYIHIQDYILLRLYIITFFYAHIQIYVYILLRPYIYTYQHNETPI